MIPVVLSGGSGTRLWPVSRTKLPKQFCDLYTESLQTLTLKRAQRLGTPWIVTTKNLKDLTDRNLHQLEMSKIKVLCEPQAKNTAPALAFLCQYLMLQNRKDDIVGIFPADQLIENEDVFVRAASLAEKEARKGFIVTLGIKPSHPVTGYGYIQTKSEKSAHEAGLDSFPVQQFHEKPTLEKAKEFLAAGNYFWNAGMFIFKVEKLKSLFEKHEPEIWNAAQKLKADLSNLEDVYDQFRNISIDFALIEKLSSEELLCIPCEMGWSDVGSWDAITDFSAGTHTPDLQIDIKSEDNFVHPLGDKTYAFVGVKDLIVVDTKDALLVTQKGESQGVKEAVEKLKALKPLVISEHVYEERPWGRYEVLKNTDYYKSKVIQVKPSAQISYQSHAKREEHWLVTKGLGEVILEDKIIPVAAGTYVKIPLGAKHRIRCTGKDEVEFIEVQLGTYFGEDDIVRYEDDYNRI